jgi:hypothetical protein
MQVYECELLNLTVGASARAVQCSFALSGAVISGMMHLVHHSVSPAGSTRVSRQSAYANNVPLVHTRDTIIQTPTRKALKQLREYELVRVTTLCGNAQSALQVLVHMQ